ncbi:MAG TPA: branched-chain amino acid transaminase [Candidatus Polarisedimenticolaceae bacterium]|nr:branched-chain amino acid transaminase [Candidatus Polarisedimenticolaceae bacterium]
MRESIVYLDGAFLPERETRVPVLTHALHYGTGIFEGIRAYRDARSGEVRLFRAKDHFDRMRHNVTFLNINLPLTSGELVQVAAELIRRNGLTTDVYVRPLAYKSAQKIGVGLPPEDAFAMIALPMGPYVDTEKGLHCGVSSWRRIQDNAIPCRAKICGAYVNSSLAAQEARDRGFDEAIFLNETGHVAEGSAMNIFLVRDGHLVTPDVSQGILEGITRDTVMTLGAEGGIASTEQRPVDRTELYVADEVFLCGTAAQIAPVTRIDGRVIGAGQPGPITLRLQSAYDAIVRGAAPAKPGWLEPVGNPQWI